MPRTKPGILTLQLAAGGGAQIRLELDVTTIGRSQSCVIVVPLPTVSRLHALIELQHDRYVLSDADSANGTFVNGRQIGQGHHLSTGDEIWLGTPEATLSFSDPEETLVVAGGLPPPLLIDERARAIQVYGVPAFLSPLEYGLLLHLATHPGTVCTRESCFQEVWGQPYDPATCEDALNACVAKLRRNLRASAESAAMEPPPITTVPRVGFRLDAEVAFAPRGRSAEIHGGHSPPQDPP